MPYLCDDLTNLLSASISEDGQWKYDTARCFNKCRNPDEGDISCFVSQDVDSLAERLRSLFQTAGAGLKDSAIETVDDRIFISLNRPKVFKHGLHEALHCGSQYGGNELMKGKKVFISIDTASLQDSPSLWRLEKTSEILQNAVSHMGGVCLKEHAPESFQLAVSNKNRRPLESGAVILVGSVSCKNPSTSTSDINRAISEQISQMSQVRLGGEGVDADKNLYSLTNASMTFAMLSGNLSKTVNVRLDSSINPFCKGAVFVLYNYCRMTHVIFKFKKMEKSGSYPPLPDLDLVDFTLLSDPDEWDLMWDFVVDWPQVFESSASGLETGEFKLHRILDFLKSLAAKFSAYYRRTRILTEPRPHLLPVLHARIYLVMGLMEVYRNALDLLSIQPVQNM